MKTTYISTTDTAKLIRAALKKAFPGVKFSVTSKKYSGGASIDVDWIDGPADALVDAVAKQYAGSNFDGMIDMKNSYSCWLMPDGSACVASDPGTTGSAGVIPPTRQWMPHPDAKLVHFCADFVFTHRTLSAALLTRARNRLAAKGYPVEVTEIVTYPSGGAGVRVIDHSREASRGFDMEREIYAAARRTHCT